jgi:hypothetical protein
MGDEERLEPAARREARTEQAIRVRQVTHFQVAWTEQERAKLGAVTIQLLLDHGSDEYVLRPTAEDALLLVDLLRGGGEAYFDLERKVLMFGTRTLGSDARAQSG